MIAIVNVSGEDCKRFGENTYSLRINRKEICRFTHERQHGLAECLRKAAEDEQHRRWIEELMAYSEDRVHVQGKR